MNDPAVAFAVAGDACAGIGLLKQLALNSIEHSIVDTSTRASLLSEWAHRWELYVDRLLSEHR